jgi:hypothetical protein
MRTTRTLAAGLACLAVFPALAAAQRGRAFEDSWFWGAKGGVSMFKSASEDVSAPLVGGEWLITRSRVGLYASIDQSFFDTQAAVFGPSSSGSVRPVDISDMRRYSLALMGFPKRYGSFRPYIGVGYAINVIQSTNPVGNFSTQGAMDSVFARIDDEGSRASVMFMGGVQMQLYPISLFAQATLMPTRNRFLINGAANTAVFEAGLRYNLASAIERLKGTTDP